MRWKRPSLGDYRSSAPPPAPKQAPQAYLPLGKRVVIER